jgi:hypothetical protein
MIKLLLNGIHLIQYKIINWKSLSYELGKIKFVNEKINFMNWNKLIYKL